MLKTRLEILQAGALALAFACSGAQALAQVEAAAPVQQQPYREDVGKEVVVREQGEAQADALVKDAVKAYSNGNFKESVDKYLAAIDQLEACGNTSDYVKGKIEECKRSISKTYYAWAQKIAHDAEKSASSGDMDVAIDQCKKAKEIYPPYADKMDEAIKKYTDLKNGVVYRTETSEATADPKKEVRVYNIDVLLKQGDILYKDRQWDQARDKYEEVLSRDPYNSQAIDAIRKVNLKLFEYGNKRTELTRNERYTETSWKSITPLIPRSSNIGQRERVNEDIIKDDTESAINRKLKDIIIDHIEFEDVTIPTVVKYLKQRSKDRDPEKVGINIFLRLSSGDATAAPAGDAAKPADGAAPAAAPAASGSSATVTMVVDDIPLGEAIRYICRAANLKSRIERYAVVIASQDIPLDEVETRIYPLEKEALDIIGGGSDQAAVQQYFEKRGIGFPVGAKIVYDERISRLIVTNTPDNLGKMEDIIREMNVVDPQVLIQAKFVEITQNDLEELGFQYTIADAGNQNAYHMMGYANNSLGYNQARTVVTDPASWGGANQRYTDPGQTGHEITEFTRNNSETGTSKTRAGNLYDPSGLRWDPNSSQMVRNESSNIGAYNLNSSRPDQMFGYTKAAGRYYYNATVSALDQSDSADVLSTPRVTTMNGQEAVIRMITQFYYPTSWGQAQVSTSGNFSIFTASTPSFGDPTDEGIVLKVTPNVDADHYTITLQMNPVVQQRVDWLDYSYSVTQSAQTYTNVIKMPVIEARTVETTVSCYDGETIVLGGIIKDTTTNVDDGYPILCDLPLVGRMFQTKGKNSTKTNLLMFLTCRLVNPDGSPIRERDMRGLPPFRQ